MNTLSQIMSLSDDELKSKIESIDASAVQGRSLRRRFEKIRRKSGGFTLLELLVVVAILAAIGTLGALMLQDTDRKAAAGAHVAMMGELANAIQVYAVSHGGQYPDNWDSLMQSADGTMGSAASLEILSPDLTGSLVLDTLAGFSNSGAPVPGAELQALTDKGIAHVGVVDTSADGCTAGDIASLINSKLNNVVATNIYKLPVGSLATNDRAGGCGADPVALADGDSAYFWNTATAGEADRVKANVNDRLIAFGIGPNSDLFDPTQIGALAAVPVYRHVTPQEYSGFVVLFNLGNEASGTTTATFHAIIDGAGDTQEEELGELDGVRAT